jgi:hypothetical protein
VVPPNTDLWNKINVIYDRKLNQETFLELLGQPTKPCLAVKYSKERAAKDEDTDAAGGPAPKRLRFTEHIINPLQYSQAIVQVPVNADSLQ